jgi:hypothetical protein
MPNVYEEVMNIPRIKLNFGGKVEVGVIRVADIKCKMRVGGSAFEEIVPASKHECTQALT